MRSPQRSRVLSIKPKKTEVNGWRKEPAFAERTGFTDQDLELLFEAVLNMFEHDRSAARGEMVVRGLYDFEHFGTQGPSNAEQNRREARLGCAHAHKLFEGVKVRLKEG